ncbi:phosphatase PAP2 family protein [Streptomyces coacervatus]|uniref:Phosphatase PAP2 family protein n=1 Tax=Streptomyces coacervatus TaxID=647381 RepID=A0ABP7JQB2_9ACTN|nr:phosphatase PAP2 family protein [Streptomyces coacervatus]MDF2263917.1 phosphatase PAP2 family protein [Streptomyces coacervatus]
MTGLAFSGASVDGGLYTWITGLARHTPHAVNSVIAVWSDYGLALFGALMLAAWWRARSAGQARMVRALAAPVVVVVCYVVDVLVKAAFAERRPCRTLHTATVEACPGAGDWSFPSNHAVIAGAAAVALALAHRRLGRIAALAAVLMAVSRVWVGVHYPHDVAVGLAFGAGLAWFLMLQADRAAPLVGRMADTPLRPLVTAS